MSSTSPKTRGLEVEIFKQTGMTRIRHLFQPSPQRPCLKQGGHTSDFSIQSSTSTETKKSRTSLLMLSLSYQLFMQSHCSRKILGKEYISFEFDVESFLSTSCKATVQVRSRPASLKVTHRYGHCSKSGLNDEPSLKEILDRDEIRVASIQNKRRAFKSKDSSNMDDLGDSKVTIPAKSGIPLGTGNYVVRVGLGTPAKEVTLTFDTGSSLTWTQCSPQKDAIFDPSASTSYSNLSCNSAQCSQLSQLSKAGLGIVRGCVRDQSTCSYGAGYVDGSSSIGFLGNERLTLTPNDVFDNFTFGCGEEGNYELFGDTDGLLGLGRDYFSVASQTAAKYGKYFSYCLPTKSGSNGHVTFGNDNGGAPGNLAFTPLVNDPQGEFYIVNLVAISVGGTQLTISPSVFQSGGGTIIDSGTVITRLPPTAYTALRDAFKQQMSQSSYPLAPAFYPLDTCYDLSNNNNSTTPQGIPSISFTFEGNVKVDLVNEGVLFRLAAGQSIFCLAYASSATNDAAIFGNAQQQTHEVAYDVASGRLGFAPNGCS